MEKKKTAKIFLIFILFLANCFVWEIIFSLDGNLKIVFFAVGQGDSTLIETSQGHQILIDGGPSGKTILEKLDQRMPFWDKTIDLIILTHPDADHLTGLNSVLDSYQVENILWTGVIKENETFKKWQEKIKSEGAKIFIARKGQIIKTGQTNFYIFYPFENLTDKIVKDRSNDTSIVLKMAFGKTSALFTGDISKKIEGQLLLRSDFPVNMRADILKISHHGSATANSEQFIGIVNPQLAVISCAKNNQYNFPNPVVLQTLKNFAILTLRTDQQGDIKMISDGSHFH